MHVNKSIIGLLFISILKCPALQGKVTEESLVVEGPWRKYYNAALEPACGDDSVPWKLTLRLRHYIAFDELGLSQLVERDPFRRQDKIGSRIKSKKIHYTYGPRAAEPHVFSLEKNPVLLYTLLKEIYLAAG